LHLHRLRFAKKSVTRSNLLAEPPRAAGSPLFWCANDCWVIVYAEFLYQTKRGRNPSRKKVFFSFATDNSLGNATLTISSFSPPGGVLPVRLSSFTAQAQTASVLLQWTAATERNTSHYEIERSADGVAFHSLGSVKAGAMSYQYRFLDPSPVTGTNLYRLRMVDNDGSFSYSGIKAVKRNSTSAQKLYPNPANGFIVVTLAAQTAGTETLQVFNAAGNLLQTETISTAQGINNKQLDITSLPKGVYRIRALSAGWIQSFVKN
jgi:hypothetical protein